MKMTVKVEDAIRKLMPEVAVEFLQGIVGSDDTIRAIRLFPVELSLDRVQEIVLENWAGTIRRRVFGFPPVRATLCVSRGAGEVVMRLAA